MDQQMFTSFPREKINILLLENINSSSIDVFNQYDYTNIETYDGAMNEDELIEKIRAVRVLGIRSKTQLTKRVLESADKLLAVGCFCIGTNQVDLHAATNLGISVFNAPFSNTRSVAELVLASAIMLIRKVPEKSRAAHDGKWLKDSKNCHEIRGKKLGIVGYGHIGSQVSVLAEALGMEVFYYDIDAKLPLGNANEIASLTELIEYVDIVTLHVPGTKETQNLIDRKIIQLLRPEQIIINMSRGDVVDLDALADSLKKGHIAGAAIDVFPKEPKNKGDVFQSPLQHLHNVILTPHIGGSTEEAQHHIGIDVSNKIVKYLETGATIGSHSVPELSLPKVENTHRILHIHKNVPGVLSEINRRLSDIGVNVLGQYLKTNEQVGYVVLDIPKSDSEETLEEIKQVNHTIRARVLY